MMTILKRCSMQRSFDIEAFYAQAIDPSTKINPTPVLDYINSFRNVILFGAANFGREIGAFLARNKVGITAYWDERADEIGMLGGSVVMKPFTGWWSNDDTLVILCINNNVLKAPLYQSVVDAGFTCLKGEYLYMGALCPFIDQTGVKASKCIDPLVCRFICCERLTNIVASRVESKPGTRIDLTYVCVVVNSVCNLDCKGCVQYINNYPRNLQTNVPTGRVCQDIKRWLGTVDSIGGVSVMGGETFLHPGIHLIAEALSECENFGLASFPTNGCIPFTEEKLEYFRDPRLSINFGNYKRVLNPKQLDIFDANVELVRRMGLSHTVGNPMEKWIKPSTLYDLERTPTEMSDAKSRCHMPPRNLQAKNGKIFPCDLGVAINNIGILKPDDFLEIDTMTRDSLRAFIDRPYYLACSHCDGYHETCTAMEQGHHDFTQPSEVY